MNDYQLLDFGNGRKLERFGPYVLDRPAPAAEGIAPRSPECWAAADAVYQRRDNSSRRPEKALVSGGAVSSTGNPPDACWRLRAGLVPVWNATVAQLTLELRFTPFGHVGLFPEHVENWEWVTRRIEAGQRAVARPLRVLNLFAYTGGATLAAARAGAEVTHVDAARNVVAWARKNAELSGLAAAPIRWIAEDARKFVARELRRGRRYDGVILDPPSYGHGPKGETWKIDDDLPPLLADSALIAPQCHFVVLTCHSPGYEATDLAALLARAGLGVPGEETECHSMALITADGRRLASGVAARWARSPNA